MQHPQLLQSVVDFIQVKMMPTIKRYAVSGRTMINTEDPLFTDPVAIAILIDIFPSADSAPAWTSTARRYPSASTWSPEK